MKPSQLRRLLLTSFQHRKKVLVVSEPGCGKSDLVEQATAELDALFKQHAPPKADPATVGCDLVISHPAVSDPTDYKGMPAVVGDGSRAEFLPFGDLNRLIEAKRLTVCFLDDLGQAAPAVQAALMQLILARRVNGHKISPHVVFCAATNDTTHMAGVSVLEPVKSRWDTIVKLDVDVDEWCAWALRADLPPEIVAFIRFRPALLNQFKPTRNLTNSPSPRTVAAVGGWLKAGVKDYDVIAGAAGEGFATEFIGFLKIASELPNLDAILLDPRGAPLPESPAACFAVVTGLARKAEPNNFERVVRYLERLAKEYEVCGVRDAMQVNKSVCNTPAFVAWATKNANVLK